MLKMNGEPFMNHAKISYNQVHRDYLDVLDKQLRVNHKTIYYF